jgi:hypothetical protein
MQKLTFIILCLAAIYFSAPLYGADTNQAQTVATSTNGVPGYTDAELQSAAQQVWHKLIFYGILLLVGGISIAGFAVYGAYRAFGFKGVIGIGIIILFCFYAIGSMLIQAF